MQQTQNGICFVCNAQFPIAECKKHMNECVNNMIAETDNSNQSLTILHLVAEVDPKYWLYVIVRSDATLKDLNKFLREYWMEDDHLSCFEYISAITTIPTMTLKEIPMKSTIKTVFCDTSVNVQYIFDYGAWTYVYIKLVGIAVSKKEISHPMVIAKNVPLYHECTECKKAPGVALCSCDKCMCEGCSVNGCAECQLEQDELSPVFDSPRMGRGGFDGSDCNQEIYNYNYVPPKKKSK